jgi:hypothetical protein
MAATDDMVPQVEDGIQGTRPRGVPTAWERTWAGMTRRPNLWLSTGSGEDYIWIWKPVA